MSESARISPTAHYTGYVWTLHGLSVDALRTPEGAVLHALLWPFQRLGRIGYGGNSLDDVLIQRHTTIDARLGEAIRHGEVRRVLEIAGGLSARGLRFATGYPEIRYVEGDLPGMASRKRRMLNDCHRPPNHAVVAIDALHDEGANALGPTLRRELPGEGKAAIITEGLLNYFDRQTVTELWARIRAALSDAGGGVYFADLHVGDETSPYAVTQTFLQLLGVFARGSTHIHFEDAVDAENVLRSVGFTDVRLRRPRLEGFGSGRGRDVVRVIEAWC